MSKVMLGIILCLSLCANAFLGGLVLSHKPLLHEGRAMLGLAPQGPQHKDRYGSAGEMSPDKKADKMAAKIRGFLRDLPADVRAPLSEAFESGREQFISKMQNMRALQEQTAAALSADPFDQAALAQALEQQRALQREIQKDVHDRLRGAIEQLSPEQRRALAQASRKLFH